MIAQYPCIIHQNKELIKVCMERSCKENKLLCESCLKQNPIHDLHEQTNFLPFIKTWQKLDQLNSKTRQIITNALQKAKQKFSLYLKSVEAKILAHLDCYEEETHRSKLKELQIQQIYGLSDKKMTEKSLRQLLRNNIEFSEMQQMRKKEEIEIVEKIQDFEGKILLLMNDFIMNIKNNPIYNNQKEGSIIGQGNFTFSEKLKSKTLATGDNNKLLLRPGTNKNGLTTYGLIEQPLTQKFPSITFKIQKQGERYMYLGVCQKQSFIKLNFQGPVYQIGRQMYAIRQHAGQNRSAVTLHNSLKQYSNKENVGWDFRQGDEVTIKVKFNEQILVFIWNNSVFFEMPLKSNAKQYYPFVGIKFQGGQISIVDSKKKEKQGFLSNLLGCKS